MSAWKTFSMSLSLAVALTAVAEAGPPVAPNGPVRIGNRFLARRVQHALDGAVRRLESPACRQIFTEFTDQQGRLLEDNLRELGETGPSFLQRLFFYEDNGHPRCNRQGTLALTWPNSRVVLVCSESFRAVSLADPRLAEVVLIHEALHGLGLGENPPTSHEITTRVLKRCRG
jgi:hypothetical protein